MMDEAERAAREWASRDPKFDPMRDYVCVFRVPGRETSGGMDTSPYGWVVPTDERLASHLAMMLLPDGFIPVVREVLGALQERGTDAAGEMIGLDDELPKLESALLFPDDSYGIRVFDAVKALELQVFLPPKMAATFRHPSSQARWAWR